MISTEFVNKFNLMDFCFLPTAFVVDDDFLSSTNEFQFRNISICLNCYSLIRQATENLQGY